MALAMAMVAMVAAAKVGVETGAVEVVVAMEAVGREAAAKEEEETEGVD